MTKNKTNLTKISEVELIYRSKVNKADLPTVKTSDDCYKLLMLQWDMNKIDLVEEVCLILLDGANHCIGVSRLSSGGGSNCIVDPRIVFATALKANATAIVLAHNHPSHSLKPSQADKGITTRLDLAGALLDIPLLDHLIVTPSGYFSFADNGLIP